MHELPGTSRYQFKVSKYESREAGPKELAPAEVVRNFQWDGKSEEKIQVERKIDDAKSYCRHIKLRSSKIDNENLYIERISLSGPNAQCLPEIPNLMCMCHGGVGLACVCVCVLGCGERPNRARKGYILPALVTSPNQETITHITNAIQHHSEANTRWCKKQLFTSSIQQWNNVPCYEF